MSEALPEIRPGDPERRRRLVALMLAVAATGSADIVLFESWFREAAWQDPLLAKRASWAVVWLAALCPAFMAGYLFVLVGQIRRAGSYPPPELKVVRDTRILRGKDARRVAFWLQVMAVMLIIGAVALPVMFYLLLGLLERGA